MFLEHMLYIQPRAKLSICKLIGSLLPLGSGQRHHTHFADGETESCNATAVGPRLSELPKVPPPCALFPLPSLVFLAGGCMEMRPVGTVTTLGCLRLQGVGASKWGEHEAEVEGICCLVQQEGLRHIPSSPFPSSLRISTL